VVDGAPHPQRAGARPAPRVTPDIEQDLVDPGKLYERARRVEKALRDNGAERAAGVVALLIDRCQFQEAKDAPQTPDEPPP
jgi:hypothetical protein